MTKHHPTYDELQLEITDAQVDLRNGVIHSNDYQVILGAICDRSTNSDAVSIQQHDKILEQVSKLEK